MRVRVLFLALLLMLGALPAFAVEKGEVPRVLLALYSSRYNASIRSTLPHRFLEMPLNRLGYYLRFVDVEKPLPEVGDDVRGVVVWIAPGIEISRPDEYVDWLQGAVDKGKKLLIFDDIGLSDAYRRRAGSMDKINNLLAHIGMRDLNSYNSVTYQGSVLYQDPEIVGFERALPDALPSYQETVAIPGVGESHLRVLANKSPETIHDIIVTGPSGGYIASGYTIFEGYPLLPIKDIEEQKNVPESERDLPDPVHQWYINPFNFLRLALHDEEEPKPDVTTQNGLRIFYSHIDGDGWNNLTQIRKYQGQKMIAAEVIKHELLEAYSDIPINVSVIAGEIDPDCYGLRGSRKVAEDIYRLPNVEPSSHTYTHPLFWGYFEHYDPKTEASVLDKYPRRPRPRTLISTLFGEKEDMGWEEYFHEHPEAKGEEASGFEKLFNREARGDLFRNQYYETPRSYACGPYSLEREIGGSIDYIKTLVPKDKRKGIRLIQWSGNTSPYEEALRETREAGLLNINGGDSRYDSEYPSYASVSPIGVQIGKERQIYSSNSNENTYTNLWTDRFYGFIYLQTTVKNTEMPMRVQPFNIYFHMFSGEKQASLAALLSNVEFARHQSLARMFASDFSRIAEGFYSLRLKQEGEGRWRVLDRGALNTLRLDDATLKTVDFSHSEGILGQRYYQGSLYISLDPDAVSPLLVLKNNDTGELYVSADKPYVISASWLINKLIFVKKSLMFMARGFGEGEFSFKFPYPDGEYEVVVKRKDKELLRQKVTGDRDGVVSFSLAALEEPEKSVEISIVPFFATQ